MVKDQRSDRKGLSDSNPEESDKTMNSSDEDSSDLNKSGSKNIPNVRTLGRKRTANPKYADYESDNPEKKKRPNNDKSGEKGSAKEKVVAVKTGQRNVL